MFNIPADRPNKNNSNYESRGTRFDWPDKPIGSTGLLENDIQDKEQLHGISEPDVQKLTR